MPKPGLWVPTNDGIFYEDTGIPFETLPFEKRKEALKRLEQYSIPAEQLSGFWKSDNYDNDRFVGRFFDPGFPVGRFFVYADVIPSYHGDDWVGSLPAKPEIAMEAREKAKAATQD